MAGVVDNYFGVHAKALHVWSRRAELLASNIAHADTPHYKAKDIEFTNLLKTANRQSTHSVQLQGTNEGHIAENNTGDLTAATKYRIPLQPSLDGNTVDSQIEHSLFAENAVRHQISLQLLGNRINSLVRTLREE